MTGEPDIRAQIADELRWASDRQLLQIMSYIDRLPSRQQVDDVVFHVRDRLAAIRPPRPLSLTRVLALPFSDLLVDGALAEASPWLIPRSLLVALNSVMGQNLNDAQRISLQGSMVHHTLDDRQAVHDAGAILWPALAAALVDGHTGSTSCPGGSLQAHRTRLPMVIDVLHHAGEIVRALEHIPTIPSGRWQPNQYRIAGALLRRAAKISENLLRACSLMLIRRSGSLEEVFALLADRQLDLPLRWQQRLIEETSLACLSEGEALCDHLSRPKPRSNTATATMVQRLVTMILSIEQVSCGNRLPGRRLAALRARAESVIAATFSHGLEVEMQDAVVGLTGRERAPDEEVLAAEALARALRKIEIVGTRLGLGDRLQQSLQDRAPIYGEMVKRRMPREPRATATDLSEVMDGLRLIEILYGTGVAISLVAETSQAPCVWPR